MLVRTVSTSIAVNTAGQVVEALPVRLATGGETDGAGFPVSVVQAVEDPNGIPIRIFSGKSAQNSAGQWVDTLPIDIGIPPELPAFGLIFSDPNNSMYAPLVLWRRG